MIKKFGRAAAVVFSLMFAQVQAKKLSIWENHTSYAEVQGLRLKPIIVIFNYRGVLVNQRRMNTEAAFQTLKRSKSLAPLPDIMVRADRPRSATARSFVKRINDAGLCENRKCVYRFNRGAEQGYTP